MAGNHRIKTLQQETDQASPKALCLEDREAVTLGVGSALAKVGPRTCSSQTEIETMWASGESSALPDHRPCWILACVVGSDWTI